jgi:hypothetical protein
VSDVYGYVSLYPLMLKVLDVDSPQLGMLLEGACKWCATEHWCLTMLIPLLLPCFLPGADLDNTTLLWTPYGLRSIATTSRYYMVWGWENGSGS